MDSVSISEAKAKFSAIIEAASKGKTTIVTNHGDPVAIIAPFEERGRDERPTRPDLPSFEEALLTVPHELEF